jgi:hypothetical protein
MAYGNQNFSFTFYVWRAVWGLLKDLENGLSITLDDFFIKNLEERYPVELVGDERNHTTARKRDPL